MAWLWVEETKTELFAVTEIPPSQACSDQTPSYRMTSRPRTTSFVEAQKSSNPNFGGMKISSKDGSKVMTVIASPGQGPDRSTEVSYTDTKVRTREYRWARLILTDMQVIGNGSFGVVYQAKLCETGEMVAIKKVLQDKRFKNRELQIMRRLDHCNIVSLLYFFYTSGEKKVG